MLERRTNREHGQSLVMFVFMLTGLLGMVALSVDVGLAYREKQSAQSAVDAAALAAAGVMRAGGDVNQATTRAEQIAEANGYVDGEEGVRVYVTIPPDSGPNAGQDGFAEVEIDSSSDTEFARVFNVSVFGVSARAVAGSTPGNDPIAPRALFSLETNCGAFDIGIAASGVDVIGGVHSNSEVEVSGSNNDFTNGIHSRVCGFVNGGSDNVYDPPFVTSGTLPDPLGYEYSDVPCTRTFTNDTDLSSVNDVWVNDNPSSNTMKPGVYCSTKKLTLSKSDVTGNVTLVAHGQISISGSGFNLTPYWNNVLLFTDFDDNSALDLSGSDGLWEGFIYAPKGKAKLNGSANLTVMGAVVAEKIEVSGGGLTIDSTQFLNQVATPPGPLRLVE